MFVTVNKSGISLTLAARRPYPDGTVGSSAMYCRLKPELNNLIAIVARIRSFAAPKGGYREETTGRSILTDLDAPL